GFSRVDFARHLTVYLTFQYTASSGFLFRSENGGSGLHSVTSGINHNDPANFYTPYVMDPSNSSRLLLGTNRVYETLNQGNNWMPISAPLAGGWTTTDVVDSVAAAGSDANTVYATAANHVFVTHDH